MHEKGLCSAANTSQANPGTTMNNKAGKGKSSIGLFPQGFKRNMKERHNMTPLKAVRAYCLQCCNGQSQEVKLCPSEDCALWAYRLGTGNVSVKTIRARCIDCAGSSPAVKECAYITDCPLYQYREGHNPAMAGQSKGKVPPWAKTTVGK